MSDARRRLIALTDIWRYDPAAYIRDTFDSDPYGNPVELDPIQREILEAVRDHDRVAVMSGRGVGKTATAAMLTHWWIGTRRPAVVVVSAGTWSHLKDKLCPEITAWGRNWMWFPQWEYQVFDVYSKHDGGRWRETWKVVSASSDKAPNVEGFHSPNLLLIIDEAKGMPDEIYSALIGSLSGEDSEGSQKAVVLSTPPTADVGWYANACSSDRWHTVHLSGLDSPRVSRAYIEEIRETFGENSNEYQAFVLGVIPGGVTGQLIQKAWIVAAQKKGPEMDDLRPPVITLDVARGGEDLATIGVIQHNKFNLVQFEDHWGWFAKNDLMDLVARIGVAVRRIHKGASAVCIDDTGLGGGVTDRLRELQTEGAFPASCSIIPVNFGAKPRRPDRFFLRKHEMWWSLREFIRGHTSEGDVIEPAMALPTDEEIRAWRLPKGSDFKRQLLGPIYESNMREQIFVYDKRVSGKEQTKSLPLKSPDLAHALILGVDYYQRQERRSVPSEPPSTGEEALRRMMQDLLAKQGQRPMQTPFSR